MKDSKMHMTMPFFCIALLFLAIFTFPSNISAAECRIKQKVRLQEETRNTIEELSHHYIKDKDNFHTIFSDRTKENVTKYDLHYDKAVEFLDRLKRLKVCWEIRKKQNRFDKNSLVYLSTVHLAMHSIYKNYPEFIYYKKHQLSDEEYKDLLSEWKENASDHLRRAHKNIKAALKVDMHYKDARILMAEYLVLNGDYPKATERFKELEAEGWFNDEKSFIYSWKAYIELMQKNSEDTNNLMDYLNKAKAFEEPLQNGEWAKEKLKAIRRTQSKTATIDFFEIDSEAKIEEPQELLRQMATNIGDLRAVLRQYMDINIESEKDAIDKFDTPQGAKILLDLATDQSEKNITRYFTLLKDIHQTGQKIEQDLEKWQTLAARNIDDGFFYLLNKTTYMLSFTEIIDITYDLSQHPAIKNFLKKVNKDKKEEDKIELVADWQRWKENYLDELVRNINLLQKKDPGYLYPKILAFECNAIFSKDPEKALAMLDAISDQLKNKNLNILVGSKKDANFASGDAYIAYWKSYLAQRQDGLTLSKKYLAEGKYSSGMEQWSKDQSKRLQIIKKLNKSSVKNSKKQ